MLRFPTRRRAAVGLLAAGLVLAAGCYRSRRLPDAVPGDGGVPPDAILVPGPDAGPPGGDRDGDGVPDGDEDGCLDPDAFDTDGDGIGDGQELELGLDPCTPDSDGDGQRDLIELGRHVAACPDTPFDPVDPCEPPGEFLTVRLVSGAASRLVGVTHAATTRDVDVLVLRALRGRDEGVDAIRPFDVAFDAWDLDGAGGLRAGFASVWLGAAGYRDFPFLDFGEPEAMDAVLTLYQPMLEPSLRVGFPDALDGVAASGGGDLPDAVTEALFRLLDGGEVVWTPREGLPTFLPDLAAGCEVGRFGAACFRDGAQTVVAVAPATCSHEGPPGDDAACDPYGDEFMPLPTSWEAMLEALVRADVRVVGVRDAALDCDLAAPQPGTQPCFLLDALARGTGSVRRDGTPITVAFGGDDAADRAAFVDAVRDAVREARFDLRGEARAVATEAFDPAETVVGLAPACLGDGPARCWRAPPGVFPTDAVEETVPDGFEGVLDGTELDFRLELEARAEDASPRARAGRLDLRFVRGADRVRDVVTVVVVVEATPPAP